MALVYINGEVDLPLFKQRQRKMTILGKKIDISNSKERFL